METGLSVCQLGRKGGTGGKEEEMEGRWGWEENGNLHGGNPVTHNAWGLFQITLDPWAHPSHHHRSPSPRW